MIAENACGLKKSTQEKLNQLFSTYSMIDEVVLYGSRAKGTFKNGSDIDLTIKSKTMTINDLLKLENLIDDLLLPYKVDISLYDQIDNKNLLDHIHNVGLLFYKKY